MSTAAALAVAAGTWTLDPKASSARFTAHQLALQVQGAIPLTATTAEIGANGDILGALIDLDITAIATGNPRRDSDLAKPALLDTRRHPVVRVVIGPAARTGAGWSAAATLAVRGAVIPAQLTITPAEPGPTGGFRVLVHTSLDRSPLGMKAPRFLIGRTIQVTVDAVFRGPDVRPFDLSMRTARP